MQFRFKIQQYQTEAARAVTDVFAGQPSQAPLAYLRDVGLRRTHLGMESLLEDQGEMSEGYGNARVMLGDVFDNAKVDTLI